MFATNGLATGREDDSENGESSGTVARSATRSSARIAVHTLAIKSSMAKKSAARMFGIVIVTTVATGLVKHPLSRK